MLNVFSLSNLRLSTVSLLTKLVKFVVLNCTIYVLLLARKLEFRKKELISKIYHSYIKKEYPLPEDMPSSRLWRVLLALLLLAALFCVPSLVLTGSEWLPELTGAVENYVPFWKGLLRFLIFCAWCWVWLWTEGSALQILLALLLQFCGIWALCLLRPRPASRAHSHA